MKPAHLHCQPAPWPRQRGFTLVELMVTVAIALFLLFGLGTVVQNVRGTYFNQQALAQLQDQQRFAMSVLTGVIESGGYYPDPRTYTPTSSLPASAPYQAGQAFTGTHVAGSPDTLGVRYRTAQNDGVILCDGSTNTVTAPDRAYTNAFSVTLPTANTPGQLMCQRDNNAPVALVSGVQNLIVYFGVKRNFAVNDYNADTYLTADQMLAADWTNISSVRVVVDFTNPMAAQPGQPAFIRFERVVEVMARAGVHT